jgi:hypothetical protein
MKESRRLVLPRTSWCNVFNVRQELNILIFKRTSGYFLNMYTLDEERGFDSGQTVKVMLLRSAHEPQEGSHHGH